MWPPYLVRRGRLRTAAEPVRSGKIVWGVDERTNEQTVDADSDSYNLTKKMTKIDLYK